MAKDKEQKKQDNEIPTALEDKDIKTKVTTFKKMVEDVFLKIDDIASAEFMMDVTARMRNRLKSIIELSSAKHMKIQGHWKTIPPKMHIRNPVARKISNDEARVTFGVYAMDDKGNKQEFENKAEIETVSGGKVKTVMSVDYRIALEVTEIIKMGKPITREIMKMGEVEQ